MPNATVRANARTTSDEDKPSDRDTFCRAYSEWLAARGAAESPAIASDDELYRQVARRQAAEIALIATPAIDAESLFDKWEVVELLLTHERTLGKAAYPRAIVALAALKADLLAIGLADRGTR